MKIIEQDPPHPLLLRIITAGMRPQYDTLFPWAPDIYNPSGLAIPPDIMIHEAAHIAQQGNNPEAWWQRYITDKQFRFDQELKANREQYKFVCKVLKDRNDRARALRTIARNMAGEVYALNVTMNKIMEMIRNG